MQLGDIGEVKRSSARVMHVRRISGPAFDTLKWRGISLDHFDGVNWRRSDRRRFRIPTPRNDNYTIKPFDKSGERVHYEVLLEPLATTALFGPFQIRIVTGRLGGLERDSDDSIYMRFQAQRRVQYEVMSEVDARNPLDAALAPARIRDCLKSSIAPFPSHIQSRVAGSVMRQRTARHVRSFRRQSGP